MLDLGVLVILSFVILSLLIRMSKMQERFDRRESELLNRLETRTPAEFLTLQKAIAVQPQPQERVSRQIVDMAASDPTPPPLPLGI